MAEPASEDLDQGLRGSGFDKEANDDYYYRIKDGQMEKRWADGDHSQSSDDNRSWKKHSNGDEY